MSNPSKIKLRDAELIFEDATREDHGSVVIDGETFEWWTDARRCVWFYEPGKDGENTVKRFEISGELHEVTR